MGYGWGGVVSGMGEGMVMVDLMGGNCYRDGVL